MVLERLRMDGKNVLVIGAGAGGMGTHTALALVEAGARVVAVDYLDERVRETEEQIAEVGGECVGITADVRDRTALKNAIAEAIAAVGQLDGLANVAGGIQPKHLFPVDEYPDDVYDEVMALNLSYVLVSSREVARHMIDRGIRGSIVSYASIGGLMGLPYNGPYSAAKAAVIALTRTMATEWGPVGIRVNAVAPGIVRTPRTLARTVGVDEHAKVWIPLGRMCESDEVAAAALFLLSDLSSVITGQTIVADGGASTRSTLGHLSRWADRGAHPTAS